MLTEYILTYYNIHNSAILKEFKFFDTKSESEKYVYNKINSLRMLNPTTLDSHKIHYLTISNNPNKLFV